MEKLAIGFGLYIICISLGIFGDGSLLTSIILMMLKLFIPKFRFELGITTEVMPVEFRISV